LIRVLLLDGYGTLLDNRNIIRKGLEATAAMCGGEAELPGFERLFRRYKADLDSRLGHDYFLTQAQRYRAVLVRCFRELGWDGDVDAAVRAFQDEFARAPVYDNVPSILPDLHRRYGLVFVGNTDDGPIRRALGDLVEEFDAFVTSEGIRVYKPSPTIFQRALKLGGVSPDEAVMVGDDPANDIAGAAALGIRTVWIRRDGPRSGGDDQPSAQHLQIKPSAVVSDLRQLYEVLGDLTAPRSG